MTLTAHCGMQWDDKVLGHHLHNLGLWPADNLQREDRGRVLHSLAEHESVLLELGALDLCAAGSLQQLTDQQHGGLTLWILRTGWPEHLIQ